MLFPLWASVSAQCHGWREEESLWFSLQSSPPPSLGISSLQLCSCCTRQRCSLSWCSLLWSCRRWWGQGVGRWALLILRRKCRHFCALLTIVCYLHPQQPSAVYCLHTGVIDLHVMGLIPPGVNDNLLCFVDIQEDLAFPKLLNLLPVGRIVVVSDQAYHCFIICIPNDVFSGGPKTQPWGTPGPRVMTKEALFQHAQAEAYQRGCQASSCRGWCCSLEVPACLPNAGNRVKCCAKVVSISGYGN